MSSLRFTITLIFLSFYATLSACAPAENQKDLIKVLPDGTLEVKSWNDLLKQAGTSEADVKKYMKKLSSLLMAMGPKAAIAGALLELLTGEDDTTNLLLREFGKLHERFDAMERQLKELKSHVSNVIFQQGYETEVVFRLEDVWNALKAFFAAKTKNSYDLFVAACKNDTSVGGRPGKAFERIDYYLNRDVRPPTLKETMFESAKYSYKSINESLTLIRGEVVQLSVLSIFCMSVQSTFSLSEGDVVLQQVDTIFKSVDATWDNLGDRIDNGWFKNQLKDDLSDLLKLHQSEEKEQLSKSIWDFLRDKYYWQGFLVLTFDYVGAPWAETGAVVVPNDDTGGMEWASFGSKGVVVVWTGLLEADGKQGWGQHEAEKNQWIEAMKNFNECDGDANDAVDGLKAFAQRNKLTTAGIYAITLPAGGVTKHFQSEREDRNVYFYTSTESEGSDKDVVDMLIYEHCEDREGLMDIGQEFASQSAPMLLVSWLGEAFTGKKVGLPKREKKTLTLYVVAF